MVTLRSPRPFGTGDFVFLRGVLLLEPFPFDLIGALGVLYRLVPRAEWSLI